jgi:uncharacterized membrane protein HdeD (DUF308 family)
MRAGLFLRRRAKGTAMSNAELDPKIRKTIHDHWRAFLTEGVILLVLGLVAIAVPPIAGMATTIIVGWVFLVGALVGLSATFAAQHAPGFWWSLLSAVIALLAGLVLLLYPSQGLITLTYVLIAFFIVDGIVIIVIAFEHRRELSNRWQWMMIGGLMDLILAVLIVGGLPGTFAWALGLLVGIDLVWGGVSLIGIGLSARQRL